jgi:hypothetical protein
LNKRVVILQLRAQCVSYQRVQLCGCTCLAQALSRHKACIFLVLLLVTFLLLISASHPPPFAQHRS